MKRSSSSYRLQIIKEVAMKQSNHDHKTTDPMAEYIHQLLMTDKPASKKTRETRANFSGNHFDERAGGWVSDQWDIKH